MLSQLLKALESYLMRTLFFENQVNSVIQSGYINLRAIAPKFNFNLKKQQLINCLIFSKVDYCNCLFVGLPDSKSMRSKNFISFRMHVYVSFLERDWIQRACYSISQGGSFSTSTTAYRL